MSLIEGRAKGDQQRMVLHLRVQQLGDISTLSLERPTGERKVSLEPRESRGCPKGAVGWFMIEAVRRMQKLCTLTSDFLLVPSMDSSH